MMGWCRHDSGQAPEERGPMGYRANRLDIKKAQSSHRSFFDDLAVNHLFVDLRCLSAPLVVRPFPPLHDLCCASCPYLCTCSCSYHETSTHIHTHTATKGRRTCMQLSMFFYSSHGWCDRRVFWTHPHSPSNAQSPHPLGGSCTAHSLPRHVSLLIYGFLWTQHL